MKKNTTKKTATAKVTYRRWRLTAWLCVLGVVMLGVTYASVPLYKMFCQLVGIPVPAVATESNDGPQQVDGRVVEIRFMAATDPQMPVQLKRLTPGVKVKVGEPTLIAYEATNPTDKDITGIAIHTVTMHGDVESLDAGQYINLLKCFCFDAFTYPAGKTVQLPVSFTVKSDLPQGVNTLVFSYTLYDINSAGK